MPGWPLIGLRRCPSTPPPTVTSPRVPCFSLSPFPHSHPAPPRVDVSVGARLARIGWRLPSLTASGHALLLSQADIGGLSLSALPTRLVIGQDRRVSAGCKTKRRGGRARAPVRAGPRRQPLPPPFPSGGRRHLPRPRRHLLRAGGRSGLPPAALTETLSTPPHSSCPGRAAGQGRDLQWAGGCPPIPEACFPQTAAQSPAWCRGRSGGPRQVNTDGIRGLFWPSLFTECLRFLCLASTGEP